MDNARAGAMKRPPRFTVGRPTGNLATVSGAELHHMRDVLRLRTGAEVELLDEDAVRHRGVLKEYGRAGALVEVRETLKSEAHELILAPAVIKGPRMDFLVEKAAELGATELWPILCARGVIGNPSAERLARWRRLAAAAAVQSLTATRMMVRPPMAFADLPSSLPRDGVAIALKMGGEPLGAVMRRLPAATILIASGPEGDFEEAELQMASRAGFVWAGLGPNRLRSETAALAALSIVVELRSEAEAES